MKVSFDLGGQDFKMKRTVMQGTLARELLSSPKEVLASDGRMLKVRPAVMGVRVVS